MTWSDRFHKWLDVPYRLSRPIDDGKGPTIVLLHGIGASSHVWRPLVTELHKQPVRVVAFDLLGFGASPKPEWPAYDIDDHAQSVIASLRKLHVGPVVLVGHSLGALVALRVARLQPRLVHHAVLFEMPLYDGLPEKSRYKARLAIYKAFYEWVIRQQPTFSETKKQFKERLATRIVSADLTRATWQPFIKSLKNSIMRQTAADDIVHLKPTADVIYGSRDMVVIRGKVADIFGRDFANVTAHTIRARHTITTSAAHFLAERIQAALSV